MGVELALVFFAAGTRQISRGLATISECGQFNGTCCNSSEIGTRGALRRADSSEKLNERTQNRARLKKKKRSVENQHLNYRFLSLFPDFTVRAAKMSSLLEPRAVKWCFSVFFC